MKLTRPLLKLAPHRASLPWVVCGLAMAAPAAFAQQSVFSRDSAGTGDWGSANLPWFYASSNNIQGDPDNGGFTRNDLFIGHNNNTTMWLNGRFYLSRDLTFQASATSQRTLNNTTNGGFSFSRSLVNESTATHIFNAPIGVDGNNAEIRVTQASGGFNLNGTIFTNGNTLFFRGAGNTSVTGSITQAGTIVKEGTGTLTLGGTHTYTGGTTVSAGSLVVNGTTSTTGSVSVAAGARLAGSGTVGAATTIAGTHAPGNNGIGLQSFSGNLAFTSSNSIFEWQLGSETTSGRGTNFDAVNVGGNLSVTNSIFRIVVNNLNLASTFWNTARTWDVFDKAATGTFASIQLFNSSNLTTPVDFASRGSFSFNTTTGDLQWTAVPEPSSALAGLLLTAGLLRRRRR